MKKPIPLLIQTNRRCWNSLHRCSHTSRFHSQSLPKRHHSSSPPLSHHKRSPQNRLPASYYRGGTSRAIFLNRTHLPPPPTWPSIFLSLLGSPDPHGRQLDGLGAGISSLSKICIVGPSSRPGIDVEYTFAAVGVRDTEVDFQGSCGNMTAAVGAFAVDSGILSKEDGWRTVRIWNVNTEKVIESTFEAFGGEAVAGGEFTIDGVAGTGAEVKLAFVDPAGSKTGKLLPTGNLIDVFDGVRATCIDVSNPCVFIQAEDMEIEGTILPTDIETHPSLLARLESIRSQAAVAMGICKDTSSVTGSIPKIAMVSKPKSHTLLSGRVMDGKSVDLVVRALSVGQPHRAVPLTVALALAAAAKLDGSVVSWNVRKGEMVSGEGITLGHSSGKTVVGARFGKYGDLIDVRVSRTARRLMDGFVYWE